MMDRSLVITHQVPRAWLPDLREAFPLIIFDYIPDRTDLLRIGGYTLIVVLVNGSTDLKSLREFLGARPHVLVADQTDLKRKLADRFS